MKIRTLGVIGVAFFLAVGTGACGDSGEPTDVGGEGTETEATDGEDSEAGGESDEPGASSETSVDDETASESDGPGTTDPGGDDTPGGGG